MSISKQCIVGSALYELKKRVERERKEGVYIKVTNSDKKDREIP